MIRITKYGDPFKGLEDGIEKSNLELGIRVVAQTKALSPVAPKFGGALRNSWMWKTNTKDGGFNDNPGTQADNKLGIRPKPKQVIVGSNLDYATYQEFGTRKMAAQPSLKPAVELVILNKNFLVVIAELNEKAMAAALKKGKKIVRF